MCQGIQEMIQEGKQEGRQEGKQEGLRQGIEGAVELLQEAGVADELIIKRIMAKYQLNLEAAERYVLAHHV